MAERRWLDEIKALSKDFGSLSVDDVMEALIVASECQIAGRQILLKADENSEYLVDDAEIPAVEKELAKWQELLEVFKGTTNKVRQIGMSELPNSIAQAQCMVTTQNKLYELGLERPRPLRVGRVLRWADAEIPAAAQGVPEAPPAGEQGPVGEQGPPGPPGDQNPPAALAAMPADADQQQARIVNWDNMWAQPMQEMRRAIRDEMMVVNMAARYGVREIPIDPQNDPQPEVQAVPVDDDADDEDDDF